MLHNTCRENATATVVQPIASSLQLIPDLKDVKTSVPLVGGCSTCRSFFVTILWFHDILRRKTKLILSPQT